MKRNLDYLMRPDLAARPMTRGRFSIPELWEKAKAMFARMIEAVGGEERLRARRRYLRSERREILGWLGPVEKLTRTLLLVRALTRLLMTPEGGRLMRETPKQAPWKAPAPEPVPGPTRIVSIPHPGWHTIPRPPSPAPPSPAPPSPAPPPPAPPPPSALRPAPARACAFRVLRCTPPERAGSALSALRQSLLLDLCDDQQSAAQALPARRIGPAASPGERPSALARRIDALSRALANPEPIIRRLARFIASLPRGLLRLSMNKLCATGLWRHGQAEFVDACFHLAGVKKVFDRIEPG